MAPASAAKRAQVQTCLMAEKCFSFRMRRPDNGKSNKTSKYLCCLMSKARLAVIAVLMFCGACFVTVQPKPCNNVEIALDSSTIKACFTWDESLGLCTCNDSLQVVFGWCFGIVLCSFSHPKGSPVLTAHLKDPNLSFGHRCEKQHV